MNFISKLKSSSKKISSLIGSQETEVPAVLSKNYVTLPHPLLFALHTGAVWQGVTMATQGHQQDL